MGRNAGESGGYADWPFVVRYRTTNTELRKLFTLRYLRVNGGYLT